MNDPYYCIAQLYGRGNIGEFGKLITIRQYFTYQILGDKPIRQYFCRSIIALYGIIYLSITIQIQILNLGIWWNFRAKDISYFASHTNVSEWLN